MLQTPACNSFDNRQHKHNFNDIPSDKCLVCNQPENCEHFFLYCTRFAEARRIFFSKLTDIIRDKTIFFIVDIYFITLKLLEFYIFN